MWAAHSTERNSHRIPVTEYGNGGSHSRGPRKVPLFFPSFSNNFFFRDEILDLCLFYSPHVFNSCLEEFWEALPGISKPKVILVPQQWSMECVAVLEM